MSSYHGNVEAHAMPSGTSMHGDATGGPLSGLLPKLSTHQQSPYSGVLNAMQAQYAHLAAPILAPASSGLHSYGFAMNSVNSLNTLSAASTPPGPSRVLGPASVNDLLRLALANGNVDGLQAHPNFSHSASLNIPPVTGDAASRESSLPMVVPCAAQGRGMNPGLAAAPMSSHWNATNDTLTSTHSRSLSPAPQSAPSRDGSSSDSCGSPKAVHSEMKLSRAGAHIAANTIFPRRKAGEHARQNVKPVVLDESTLSSMYHLPLHEAAAALGISATALKSACRKLHIKKWPYRTVHSLKHQQAAAKGTPLSTSKAAARAGEGAVDGKKSGVHASSRLKHSAPPKGKGGPGARARDGDSDGVEPENLQQDALLLAETLLLLRRQGEERENMKEKKQEKGAEAAGNGGKKQASRHDISDTSGAPEDSTSSADEGQTTPATLPRSGSDLCLLLN